jgi:hypothetical protein
LTVRTGRTVVKVVIAFALLRSLGDLDRSTALEVAALLGAADFFAGHWTFHTVDDLKVKVTKQGETTEVVSHHEESRS